MLRGHRQGDPSSDCVRIVYEGKGCHKRFDDLTGTVFAGHHLPLRAWIACLDRMGLNLLGLQIARELGIDTSDARAMIATLRQGVVDRAAPESLSGEVECDEVYGVAGHKGHPEAVKKKGGAAGGGV